MEYAAFESLQQALERIEKIGVNEKEVIRIWEEEDVPDIYRVDGALVLDLQFLDHRNLIVYKDNQVILIFSGDSRLKRWFRNVTKKRRKFLDDPEEFIYRALLTELEDINGFVLEKYKELSRYEKSILQHLKSEEKDVVVKLYEMISILLDVRRELTYFYRTLGKLKKMINEEHLEDLRSLIHETVSLIDLSISTARSLLDVHDKVLSMELNLLIKRLTAISIILAVITIITGIYGMNFRYLPLAEHPHGFWILNGLMVVLFFLMWWWFKKIGWM